PPRSSLFPYTTLFRSIDKVKSKGLYDPVLSFQLSNDFHVLKILKNYLPGDKGSQDYAVLLEWNNIYYDESPALINVRKSVVRLRSEEHTSELQSRENL